MMIHSGLTRWLQAPPATGRTALLCGICAVALPTVVRAAVNGVVTGCEFTPYLPFVLFAAILLRWWQAGAVALVSVAILGGLFFHPSGSHLTQCFFSGAAIFLASSAAMIGVVVGARRLLAASRFGGVDGSEGEIIFSLEDGEVLASWPGSGPPVRLGSQNGVEAMMEDFLAQVRVGRRLTGQSD
jgi:hypothetical protein